MTNIPESITAFLRGRRLVVAGVSRDPKQAANAVFRKLKRSGYQVFPVNPNASEVEGARCYTNVAAVPPPVDGVVIVTPPQSSADIVRQCGIRHVWLHRSFGSGSVAEDAIEACRIHEIDCIVGGCPLMFCKPVDLGHKFMLWWLRRQGRVPK
jgi:predicted CoA-binding protein